MVHQYRNAQLHTTHKRHVSRRYIHKIHMLFIRSTKIGTYPNKEQGQCLYTVHTGDAHIHTYYK